jgi:hypothetical protein
LTAYLDAAAPVICIDPITWLLTRALRRALGC